MKYIRMHGLDTKNYWRIELDDNNTLTIIKIENGKEQNRVNFRLTFTQQEIRTLGSALIDLLVGLYNDEKIIKKLVHARESLLTYP